VLTDIKRDPTSAYVLTGTPPDKPIVSLRKPWVNICTAAKIHNLRLHDLRHSFASIGAADGVSLQMIGALLDTQPTTTARYAHLAASPLHDAVDAIGAKIAAAMSLR
jgi:integrase